MANLDHVRTKQLRSTIEAIGVKLKHRRGWQRRAAEQVGLKYDQVSRVLAGGGLSPKACDAASARAWSTAQSASTDARAADRASRINMLVALKLTCWWIDGEIVHIKRLVARLKKRYSKHDGTLLEDAIVAEAGVICGYTLVAAELRRKEQALLRRARAEER